jgi:hypothetical protein
MFAMAALFLAFGPVLDSAAKAAPDAPPGTIGHALRGFDVIDDVLDHLPGQPPGAPQQQLQSPHALPAVAEVTRSTRAEAARWRLERQLSPSSTKLDSQDPPPRA